MSPQHRLTVLQRLFPSDQDFDAGLPGELFIDTAALASKPAEPVYAIPGRLLDLIAAHLPGWLTEDELKEVIIHLAFYAGWPRAMSAIQVARAVFAD